MNTYFRVIIVLCLALFHLGCSTLGGSSFELRSFEEELLPNGLRVLYVQDDSLPYFSIKLGLNAGATSEGEGESGLANFVADLLDKGTKNKSAEEIAEEIDFIGAGFSASAAHDYTLISADSLSFHQDKLLKLFAEIVTQPAFQRKEVERVRANIKARLQKLVDNPRGYANRAFFSELYGVGHPYARSVSGTQSDISKIRQKNINKFFLKNYRPNKALLAVVGKLGPNIKSDIRESFGSWGARESKDIAVPDFPKIDGKEVILVHKPGSPQAQVRIGMAGIRRTNPDYMALRIANTILGGGFASRLNDQIRDNMGLTYYIGSTVDARKFQGPIYINTFTRNAEVKTIVNEAIRLVDDFHKKGVTEKEVTQAKGLIKGKFPRSIETAERLTFNLMFLRFHGIDDSYLSDFVDNLESTSVDEVNAAIQKYYTSNDLKILIFGDMKSGGKKSIPRQLSSFKKVKQKGNKVYQ